MKWLMLLLVVSLTAEGALDKKTHDGPVKRPSKAVENRDLKILKPIYAKPPTNMSREKAYKPVVTNLLLDKNNREGSMTVHHGDSCPTEETVKLYVEERTFEKHKDIALTVVNEKGASNRCLSTVTEIPDYQFTLRDASPDDKVRVTNPGN